MNLTADMLDHLAQTSALPVIDSTFTTEMPDLLTETEAVSFTSDGEGGWDATGKIYTIPKLVYRKDLPKHLQWI